MKVGRNNAIRLNASSAVFALVVVEMHLLDISRDTPTLKPFKNKFNRSLSNLNKLKMTLLAAGGLN